jgi:outer membrane receptor protein involved in Fe transport
LYGASAMGGLIKFVTTDPSTDSVSGHIQSGISDTQNGNGLGYNVRGTVNVPLSETVAMLASGFIRQDPGYVDNIRNGQDGVNKLRVDGGRVSALWRPSEGFSLKLTAILQHRTSDGSDDVDTTLGDLQQSKLPGTGGQDRRLEVYSATLTGNVGKFDLTSITAYSISKATASEDYSPYYGSFVAPGLGVALLQTQKSDNFSQEIRLATSIGQHIDWLVGAFFTDQQSRGLQRDLTLDSLTGAGAVGSPELFTYNGPTTVSEYAGFTDLTFRITDQFDVQIGGRESEIRQTESEVETGSLVGGSSITPEVETKANAFTYLLTPRFRFSPQLMAYARLASGYRIGGPNPNITLLGLPQSFKPDKTQDYELGVKGDTLDHRLSFDASVYYIDWKDIQLYGSTDGFGYYTNASRAKSQGVELSGQARPMQWLSISAWISWNDAELKSDLPAASVAAGTYGLAGDRLPYSPRFSGGLSFDQDFNLSENVQAFVGGALSYQSERLGTFVGSPPAQRVVLPAYARTDLRAGVKCDSWRVNVFANNIANKRALLSADVTPNSFFVIQPRTIGLNVEKSF